MDTRPFPVAEAVVKRFAGLALLVLAGCGPSAEVDVVLHVGSDVIAEVEPGYPAVALDTAQVLGGVFWNPSDEGEVEVPVAPFDFDRAEVGWAVDLLGPGTLRIGGTAADFARVDLSDAPSLPADAAGDDNALLWTAERWDAVGDFAQAHDLEHPRNVCRCMR